ncbi:DUF2568 domain-containing protein [Intrasporangium calvum]|nr:DUF2568 domain-containing protein [Intrasporangium calvum]
MPLVAAVAWGLFAAPRARVRVPRLTPAVKVLVLGAAVAAAFTVLPTGWPPRHATRRPRPGPSAPRGARRRRRGTSG